MSGGVDAGEQSVIKVWTARLCLSMYTWQGERVDCLFCCFFLCCLMFSADVGVGVGGKDGDDSVVC